MSISKKVIFLLCLIYLTNCSNNSKKRNYDLSKIDNYEIIISNSEYSLNFKTGVISSITTNFKDTINFNQKEKKYIGKIFFENYIDTINKNRTIFNKNEIKNLPEIVNLIKINNGKKNIEISISDDIDSTKVKKKDFSIIRFDNKLYNLINKNKQFKGIKVKIDSLPKRIYL